MKSIKKGIAIIIAAFIVSSPVMSINLFAENTKIDLPAIEQPEFEEPTTEQPRGERSTEKTEPEEQTTEEQSTEQTIIIDNGMITTPVKSLPKNTDADKITVSINGKKGKTKYTVFYQHGKSFKKGGYIYRHGCAACSLTTVVRAFSKKYSKLTPTNTYKKLEKKVFGTSVWKKNYNRKKSPVSLYGISKVLTSLGIKNKYVRSFRDATAIKQIKKHLYTGNPVVIETNNHTQVNGKFSKKYTGKWAGTKHTMVILGLTGSGKAIIADSANRSWAGNNQRIKYASVEELVKHMIPCKKVSKSCYFSKVSASGGYILVRP